MLIRDLLARARTFDRPHGRLRASRGGPHTWIVSGSFGSAEALSSGETVAISGEGLAFDAVEPDQSSGGLPSRRRQWMAVVAASDADAYTDLVTEGVVWVPPGGEAILGRPAFRAWVQPFFRDFTYEFTVHPADVVVLEDWAVELGRFISRLSSRSAGSRIQHAGRYVVLWARGEDRIWRIDRYLDVTGSMPG